MRVFEVSTFNQQITAPKRESFGITLALRGGDVLHPLGSGNWFSPPWFQSIWRWFCPITILPWISWNLFGWRGYIGFKAYGADAVEYINFMPAADVSPGSIALMISARLYISD